MSKNTGAAALIWWIRAHGKGEKTMKTKFKSKLMSILLALVMVLSVAPLTLITVSATDGVASYSGVRPESKWGDNGIIRFTVDDAGVLTWTAVPGATSYDLSIWTDNGLFKNETGLTSTSYDLEAKLDQFKKDSGTVQVTVNARGGSGGGDSAYFLYSSPYPKLEAPANLRWNGMVAEWEDVPGATEYDIYLYQATGGAFTHWSTTESSFNFESIAVAANAIKDGWFFKVKAINVETHRDSEYNESPRKGYADGVGVVPQTLTGGTTLNVRLDDTGALKWDAVSGATSYDLTIWADNGLFKSETGLTSTSYDLEAQLNEYKKDSGTIKVDIAPKGVTGYEDTVSFKYSSPYTKLEAPTGLSWNGILADWNDVSGANGYTIYLYQANGGAYAHWTTTESQFDFSGKANPEDGWFFKVQATGSKYVRDSVYNESPVKEAEVSTQIWPIGAYVYNETLDEGDSGGQVYMKNTGDTFDWSSSGYTENAIQGTSVTVKAKPDAGYRFVEWRKGTKGYTISTDAEYSFTCAGPEYLYAIFKEDQTMPITGISLSGLPVPVVGEYIQYVDGSDLEEDISGAHKYRVIDNQTCSWKDEEGRSINYGGQVFEAGRTYSISFNVDPKDGYAFTSEDIPVKLTGLYDHEYTSSIELYQETSVVKVTFAFTLGGERTYDDIVNFRFYEMRAPVDGGMVSIDNGVWAYNNSEMTDRYWTDGSGNRLVTGSKFVGGNSYFYNYEFTAFDGYKFAENIFVRANNETPTNWEYTFNAARTTLHIKIPYFIDTSDTVSSVVVDGMFVPNQTKSTRDWDSNVYLRTSSYAHYQIPLQTKSWYEVDAEYSVDTEYKVTEPVFRAGKQYKMFLIVHAKDGYKFAPPETMSFEFSGIPANTYTYTCAYAGADDIIEVVITFTAQFPSDVGENANNPAWCYSYIELKTALESNDIRYVALGNVEDILPMIPHDEEKEPGGITRNAIVVRGTKDLNLLGDAVFRCPLTGNYDLKYYIQLITLTDAANSSLYIHGPGSLTYAGGTLNFVNSVIKMEGGHLTVDGATIRGSNGYHTAFCYGINAIFGSVSIQGGATVIGEIYGGEGGIGALTLGSEGVDRSLSVSIFDGKFYVERDEGDSNEDHGIMVNNDIGLRIYGGSFDGIDLGRYAADTLADYVMDGCTMTVNGVKTDPASCGTTSGFVEVYQEISKINIHVNSPAAGKSPAIYDSEVYLVPEGAAVESITWYENGQPWYISSGSARFTAGNTYKVEIVLTVDEGVKFAKPLTSATINYKNAKVSAFAGNPETGVVLTVDLGVCPNVVPQVELTVTAPKEGNKPSYSISCGSNAYYAVGGSSNYTEYRTWYMSSDNDDWWEINGSHQFMAGYYYKLVVDIRTNEGYEFPLYDNGSSIMPDVNAYVNNYAAKVIKAYDQDPSRYITVEYNFGECNDSVVESITITNIDAPVAGQTPDYMASCFGTGYSMAGTNSGNWKVNGIVWLRDGNIYTGSIMDNTEKFQAGHKYTVMIDLVADSGYTFQFNNSSGVYAKTSINGNTAQIAIDHCSTTKYQVWYTFTCEAQEISTVMLYDLEKPVGGNKPDTSVTPAYPEYYVVESVKWFDIEDNPVGATFETGVPYYALITVAPASGVVFADAENMTAYIDGNILPGVEVKNNKVIIPVIIRKPASAPEMTIYAFTTQPSGGTVNAGESLNVAWQTSFIPTSTEIQYWDGAAWDQWDIQYPQNALDDYDFESHEAASYRFRIVTYIGNDAVATSNEFVINWAGVAQEYIYVYTPGDGQGSNDFDYVTEGTRITLYTPEYMGFFPIEGFAFDYWSIRVGTAQSAEVAKKQPGDTIIINDNTYIIAMWKEAPLTEYICVYTPGEGQGSGDFDYVTSGTVITLQTPEYIGIYPIDGFKFDYWSIRIGNAQASESARKHVGDTVIINDNTYIIAMWKEIPHVCSGVKQKGQAATCTADGWKDYYKCSCGKFYTDAACTNNIADVWLWKNGDGKLAAGHDYGTLIPAVAEKHTKTELKASVSAHYICSACGKYFTEGKAETTLQALTGKVPAHSYTDGKCSCGAMDPNYTPETKPVAPPETTKAPETTKVPETTQTPETTKVPETTKTPENTKVPETTQIPEVTQAPETTKAPETDPVTTPDTDAPGTNAPGTAPDTEAPEKTGCGASVSAYALLTALAIFAPAVVVIKKRDE